MLEPAERSEAGYRLYAPDSVRTVQLIQRAQRLGFSLAEIKTLLAAWRSGDMNADDVLDVAEGRYHALERQITQWQVQQHELELFLQDLRADLQADVPGAAQNAFSSLVDRICANPAGGLTGQTVGDWLSSTAECALDAPDVQVALDTLRGQHVHIWEEGDAYHILVVSDDPAVAAAVRTGGGAGSGVRPPRPGAAQRHRRRRRAAAHRPRRQRLHPGPPLSGA